MSRVVLLSVDGFPVRHLTRHVAPQLVELASQGASAPTGGRSLIPASSAPNHASLLTGAGPELHRVAVPGLVPAPASARVVRVATIFDRLARAGVPTAAIVSDPALHPVLRLDAAAVAWPGSGAPGRPVEPASDEETLRRILEAVDAGVPFVFGQLGGCEAAGHAYGPDASQALAACRAADACVGAVAAALAPSWGETTLIVVSDHGMTTATDDPSIVLAGEPIDRVLTCGGAAYAVPVAGASPRAVERVVAATPGVLGTVEVDGLVLALAERGRQFAACGLPRRAGVHGGPDTRATLAVVGGGSAHAAALGRWITASPPPVTGWARPIVRALVPARAPVGTA